MNYEAGDLVFCHSNGILGKVIRFGERIRFHKAVWNHVAILDRCEKGVWYVIQAEASGVTDDKPLDTIAPNGRYLVVKPPAMVDRGALLEFARMEVGSHYGWLSIVSTALDIITPLWFVSFRRKFSWICSALVSEALRAGGWIYRWPDVYLVTPQGLWLALPEPLIEA